MGGDWQLNSRLHATGRGSRLPEEIVVYVIKIAGYGLQSIVYVAEIFINRVIYILFIFLML
jgi:hypothetical protein